jgi:hypothetical protein
MEEATVKSSGAMKKRHRGRHLAAGRHGELKKLTRGNCGSWGKLAAACRKVTRRAGVARRREYGRKGYGQDNVVQETRKGRTFGRRRQPK